MKPNLTLNINVALIAVLLTACAPKEATYWERKKGTIVIHHVRKTRKGSIDRTEKLSSDAIKPNEYHVYDVGRMPDGAGGLHEAHEWYRVAQSQTVNTMLPAAARVTRGVQSIVKQPTYSPMPSSQRINDAVAEAQTAKEQLDAARAKLDDQLAADNNLRGEMQTTLDQLKSQIDAGFSTPTKAVPQPTTEATKAADQLALWGNGAKQP